MADVKDTKNHLIPNWFRDMLPEDNNGVCIGTSDGDAETAENSVATPNQFQSDSNPKPYDKGFCPSPAIWKYTPSNGIDNPLLAENKLKDPTQKEIVELFESLPDAIKTSSLGRYVEENLKRAFLEGDQNLFEEVKLELEALVNYRDYEENVRRPAQAEVMKHFSDLPAEKIDFEPRTNNPYELYNYEDPSKQAIHGVFMAIASLQKKDIWNYVRQTVAEERRKNLLQVLQALQSEGFNDDNPWENPLRGFSGERISLGTFKKLDEWTRKKIEDFKKADLDGFLKEVEKKEKKEQEADLRSNDALKERVEVGASLQKLAALEYIYILPSVSKREIRKALIAILKTQKARLKSRDIAKTPEMDMGSIFEGTAYANAPTFKIKGDNYKEILERIASLKHGLSEESLSFADAALTQLEEGEELDPRTVEIAIALEKGSLKEMLKSLAVSAGSAEVAGEIIDPISEADSLNLKDSVGTLAKETTLILEHIDLASLANSIDDSIKAAESQMKEIDSMLGKNDAEKAYLKKEYGKLLEDYKKARELLDGKRTEEARAFFLKVYNSPFAKTINEQYLASLEKSESIKYLGRISIIVASGIVSSIATSFLTSGMGVSWGLGVKELAAAKFSLNVAAFMGTEKILSYSMLDELPYHPDAGFIENFQLLMFEIIETAAMFKFLGMGNKAYGEFMERTLFRRAESELITAGIIKGGESLTSDAAKALIFQKMELGLVGKVLNAGGALGAEYVSFSAWDLIKATAHYIASDDSVDPTLVMSPGAMEERAIFLFCLKLAGTIAMPITTPLHEKAAQAMLEKYRPQLWELAEEQSAVLKKLAEYKQKGGNDPRGIERILKELHDILRKRQNLQSALVQSGLTTVDQLAFTNAAVKDASEFEPKLKLLKRLALLVTPRDAKNWEYKAESRDEIGEIVVKLITDHDAEVTEENGSYKIKLSPEETLEIGTEEPPPMTEQSKTEQTPKPAGALKPIAGGAPIGDEHGAKPPVGKAKDPNSQIGKPDPDTITGWFPVENITHSMPTPNGKNVHLMSAKLIINMGGGRAKKISVEVETDSLEELKKRSDEIAKNISMMPLALLGRVRTIRVLSGDAKETYGYESCSSAYSDKERTIHIYDGAKIRTLKSDVNLDLHDLRHELAHSIENENGLKEKIKRAIELGGSSAEKFYLANAFKTEWKKNPSERWATAVAMYLDDPVKFKAGDPHMTELIEKELEIRPEALEADVKSKKVQPDSNVDNVYPEYLKADVSLIELSQGLQISPEEKNLEDTVVKRGGRIVDVKYQGQCITWLLEKLGWDLDAKSFSPLLAKLFEAGNSVNLPDVRVGDVIVYMRDDTEIVTTGLLSKIVSSGEGKGEFREINGGVYGAKHVGIVTKIDNGQVFITSKWGKSDPVIEAPIEVVHAQYGNHVVIFRLTSDIPPSMTEQSKTEQPETAPAIPPPANSQLVKPDPNGTYTRSMRPERGQLADVDDGGVAKRGVGKRIREAEAKRDPSGGHAARIDGGGDTTPRQYVADELRKVDALINEGKYSNALKICQDLITNEMAHGKAYAVGGRLRALMEKGDTDTKRAAADAYNALALRFGVGSKEAYLGGAALRALMENGDDYTKRAAANVYQTLARRFGVGSNEAYLGGAALRALMEKGDTDTKRAAADAYNALAPRFEVGSKEAYLGGAALRALMENGDDYTNGAAADAYKTV
ncbi:MAG: CHAP domain-containing protein, partial [Deltaproteobacteria bacterium]|nr:CHAP domain-containing protein [Deltaproteobacteria bacterium]